MLNNQKPSGKLCVLLLGIFVFLACLSYIDISNDNSELWQDINMFMCFAGGAMLLSLVQLLFSYRDYKKLGEIKQ